MKQPASFPTITTPILAWYEKHARDLPWRRIDHNVSQATGLLRDPYRILVSELMLQQTQVSRVLPKFEAFMKRWPTFKALADAQQSEVVIAWAGLGYNRRAKYLWEAAKIITREYKGVFPAASREILALPGIGPYTAQALRVFALGEHTYMIDTNVRRIVARTQFGIKHVTEKQIEQRANVLVPTRKADMWHQALMDFGSGVCTSAPQCDQCPLIDRCRANQEAREAGFTTYREYIDSHPVKKRGKSLPFLRTNRYFRGQIIHKLRSGPLPMSELQHYVMTSLSIGDVVRFGMIIEDLMKEKLITIRGSIVALM